MLRPPPREFAALQGRIAATISESEADWPLPAIQKRPLKTWVIPAYCVAVTVEDVKLQSHTDRSSGAEAGNYQMQQWTLFTPFDSYW